MSLSRIPPWLVERLKSPVAAAAALTLGIRFGQEASRLASGEITLEQFKARTGSHVGTITGTFFGAFVGSLAGQWVPGVGTVAGAFTGGMLGQMAGSHATRRSADRLVPLVRRTPDEDAPALDEPDDQGIDARPPESLLDEGPRRTL